MRISKKFVFGLFLGLFVSLSLSDLGFADIIGYYDAEHTKNDGYYSSSVSDLLANRYVFGASQRFLGSASDKGTTAWMYDIQNLAYSDIGYYDAEHTKDEGTQVSGFGYFLADRFVAGSSWRYNGGATQLGQTMWMYDTTDLTLRKIGFYNAQHTRDNGYLYSSIDAVKTNGYIRGNSKRYDGAVEVGFTRWLYDSANRVQHEIGFYDVEHVRNDGYAYGEVHMFTDSGYVSGYSQRYNGGASWLGDTSWVYDIPNAQLHEIGYYDAEHTKDTGYQYSRPEYLTESGYISGFSERYNGTAVNLGRTAWVYDIPNSQLHEIGYYDAEHTKDTGYQFTDVQLDFSESGYVIGTSKRYNGGASQTGNTGWVYDISNMIQTRIGYYDAEHTRNDGFQASAPNFVISDGYVTGSSSRYSGGASSLGWTAWLYDINATSYTDLGYYDAEHTKDDGTQQSTVNIFTEAGYASGFSARYNGGASGLGNTRWLYDVSDSSLHKVGYYDAEHTKDTGYKNSDVSTVTDNGYAFGYSDRYNGGNPYLGKTAWVYDVTGSVHNKIGFYDAEHTNSQGKKEASIQGVLSDGHAHGFSYRYNGLLNDVGYTAWVYDAQNNILAEVGVYDAEHTSDTASQHSLVETMIPAGYATGYSRRYNGGAALLGYTAWIYHIPTARQASFDFGEDIGTGEGWSRIKVLQDDGVVYGVFGHLDNTQNIDGERVFKGDISGAKEDLFETAGGDILNYHFNKDSISVDISDDGKYLIGDGILRADYHPLQEGVAFLLVLDNSDSLSYHVKTENQKSLAYALDAVNSYVGVNAIFYQYLVHHVIGSVNFAETFQQMLPQASSYASSVGTGSMQMVLDTVSTSNFSNLGSGPSPSGMQTQLNQDTSGLVGTDVSLYGEYIYSKGSQNGDVNHNGYDYVSSGMAFGVDSSCGDNGFYGLAIGYLDTDVDGENNTGDIEQSSFAPNLYLALLRNKWKLNAGLGYGLQKNESKRFCGISEIGDVEAKWDSHAVSVFAAASYNVSQAKDYSLDMVLGVDYMNLYSEAYTEEGADMWRMEIDSNDTNSFRSRLGVLFTNENMPVGKLNFNTQLRAFWIHNYLNENTTTVTSFNGSSSFDIDGISLDRDKLQLGFSMDFILSDKMNLFLTYDNQLSENSDQHEINTGFRYYF